MFEYIVSKIFDGYSIKIKTTIFLTVLLILFETLIIYNYFHNEIFHISRQTQNYLFLFYSFLASIWSVILWKLLITIKGWYLSRGFFSNTENLLFLLIWIILSIPLLFSIAYDMKIKNNTKIDNKSIEEEILILINNADKNINFKQ